MKYLILILVSFFIISCNTKNETTPDSEESLVEDVETLLNIRSPHFTKIDSSGILIIPLGMGQNKNQGKDYSYKKIDESAYWNLIFYDSNTGKYHLLTDQKMLFSYYDYEDDYGIRNRSSIEQNDFIFYQVKSLDYNQDKLINDNDPNQLFVSDKRGKNFRMISPKNGNLLTWDYIPSSNKLIMRIEEDTDQDLLFESNEEIVIYEIILGEKEVPQPIFNNNFNQKIKQLYQRDWKRID